MSFWNYRGRCIGRVIHFLYHYAGMSVAEYATIGSDRVEYRGKTFATYTWSNDFGKVDVPIFTFTDDEDFVRRYVQTTKQQEAISDGCALNVPTVGRLQVESKVLRVIHREAYTTATIGIGVFHDMSPTFFVFGERLFAEAKGWIYAWLPEANNWMVWVEGEKPQHTS